MSDVAEILGARAMPPPPPAHHRPTKGEAQSLATERHKLWPLAVGRGSNDHEAAATHYHTSGGKGGKAPPPTTGLPPMVPAPLQPPQPTTPTTTDLVRVGTKWISTKKPARPWVWAPFSSSSRTDGAVFSHWVRANVEYPDYPFARFDVHLDPVAYSDDEYHRWLAAGGSGPAAASDWTKAETDLLLDLARRFELRWPVVYDRWLDHFADATTASPRAASTITTSTSSSSTVVTKQPPPGRAMEDLQHRYYQVAAVLNQRRLAQHAAVEAQASDAQANSSTDPIATEGLILDTAAARSLAMGDLRTQPLIHHIGTGTSNKIFDLAYEKERRAYQESLWHRSKEDEVKEAQLRAELKEIDAQLRKLKRKGAGGGASGGAVGAAAASAPSSRSVTPLPDAAVAGAAFGPPVPVPGVPYLQSARLASPPTGGSNGLNKALLQRLQVLLDELKVPTDPLATKRVCDLYDSVRKDALMLLIYQKNLLQKEGLLQNRKAKLEKMMGTSLATDESVLGLATRKTAPTKKKAVSSPLLAHIAKTLVVSSAPSESLSHPCDACPTRFHRRLLRLREPPRRTSANARIRPIMRTATLRKRRSNANARPRVNHPQPLVRRVARHPSPRPRRPLEKAHRPRDHREKRYLPRRHPEKRPLPVPRRPRPARLPRHKRPGLPPAVKARRPKSDPARRNRPISRKRSSSSDLAGQQGRGTVLVFDFDKPYTSECI